MSAWSPALLLEAVDLGREGGREGGKEEREGGGDNILFCTHSQASDSSPIAQKTVVSTHSCSLYFSTILTRAALMKQ